ncbi:MAG: 50S ribosome-binding GTPase, partial [Actinomycetota bacterium]|nr:50S ribosome-binding GTPase [Actinomycetota bacterium]
MSAGSFALRRRPPRDISDLPARLEALHFVVTEAADQLDPRTAAAAERLLQRAGQRLRLSADHTVVALAGGTGSGKSSLFNALTGLDISQVGLHRPTTSAAYACVWGETDATALLDWLKVPPERRLGRESVLDAGAESELRGLVLLDLPDHDSVEVEHRLEVDRLVDLVDILVWVVDPQKYADTAIHEHYLRPLRTYADVMLVVLNQADRLDPGQAQSCLEDLRRMLTDDGLGGVRTMLTSATSRVGVADLRAVLTGAVASRESSRRRIAADLDALSDRLHSSAMPEAGPAGLDALASPAADALSELGGVSQVAAAAASDYHAAGRRRTGWPPLYW